MLEQNHFSPLIDHARARDRRRGHPIGRGQHRVGAHVGAALHLGEELRGGEVRVEVRVEQPGEERRLLLGRAQVLQGADRPGVAGQRAVVPGLAGLGGQVEQREDEALRRGRHRPPR